MDIEQFIKADELKEVSTILFIILGIILLLYIIYTFAILALAKHSGEGRFRYLSWIPIFNVYYTCKIACGTLVGLLAFILSVLSSNMSLTINNKIYSVDFIPPNIKYILSLILLVVILISIIRIYIRYSKNSIIYIILTILSCGILAPILLFTIRNNQRVQLKTDIDDINLNSNTYVDVNNIEKKSDNKEGKEESPHVEEEYDIGNSWDGPK